MKTLQVDLTDSPELHRMARENGIKRIHPGWYTIKYNGVSLDRSNVVSIKRNRKGVIR